MGAYILRRLLLVIPTLFGVMLVNFALTQFVPGGPIEQVAAQLEGGGDSLGNLTGANSDGMPTDSGGSSYSGARGLPPEFLAELEVEFGFARFICEPDYTGSTAVRVMARSEQCEKEMISGTERFLIMMGKYLTFDFGQSYFRSISVTDLILEKMPVSITLGLWSTLLAYLISIPLGIRKAMRDGSSFDTWTSGIVIAAYSIPSFLFAILLMVVFAGGSYFQWFPLRGLTSENWAQLSVFGKVKDYLWHIILPVTAQMISGFATLTLLTKNSFLDEIKKQYVLTARAKGLSETRVLYGHVFRNAMMLVIAGFPAVFMGVFFGSSLLIETIFSLDGLGQLAFKSAVERDYPVMFGTLFAFGLVGLVIGLLSDLMYVLVDPRIDFANREG
ncbi:ABC transporter permease subunit [Xinfangfangia sp. CPCC 101601]|uniref:ABC transporter permease subunit n=1 Tax=Pseudogemmobacter lacusdianii TaxID=3069608 RepID=A0ABU0VYI1_9RHOB|nr:ABC transporter permease subunit [Xinfangfangia sp. CPCC 101601]MDQ2066816.1 ABC transporter permease subunit [Xinfangfangia sp. CPCC 101601]